MGVWLAPLLVTRTAPWRATTGVAGRGALRSPVEGLRILDPFHPAAAHLRDTAARLVGWGYDLLKIDFLFAGTLRPPRRLKTDPRPRARSSSSGGAGETPAAAGPATLPCPGGPGAGEASRSADRPCSPSS
jgi:hypothetical protein